MARVCLVWLLSNISVKKVPFVVIKKFLSDIYSFNLMNKKAISVTAYVK